MRIVSLLPSATEILFALGKGDRVVGVTHECDHPPEARERPAVTADLLPPGLSAARIDQAVAEGVRDAHTIYALDEERLRALEPDVVVTQALCAVCAVPTQTVEEAVCIMPRPARVLSHDPHDLGGILSSIQEIGRAVGAEEEAAELVSVLERRLAGVAEAVAGLPRPRTAVLEWPDPPYAPGHWVPDMVEAAGGMSVLGTPGRPSQRIAWEEVEEARAEMVVLAFCGFDLEETLRRLEEDPKRWHRLAETSRLVAVDGSAYFSRPGPRIVDGVELLAWVLHGLEELRPVPDAAAHPAVSR